MLGDAPNDSRRRRWPRRVFTGVVLATIALLIALPVINAILEGRSRSRVDALLHAPDWDWNLPAVANWSNSHERLIANAPSIVKVLRKDLNFDPSTQRWRRKLPDSVARFVEPAPGQASESVRANAAYNLSRLGPAAREAVPDLISRVADSDEGVRYNVALALAAIGEDTPNVRAALTGMITNTSSRSAVVAAFGLWRIDPSETNALARLSLLRPDSLVSLGPIIARIGKAARPILPAMREGIQQVPSYHTRLAAVRNYWLASGDADLPMALVGEVIEMLRGSPTNTVDRAARSRSLNHLASAALQLGEIPAVRLELRTVLKELESEDATWSSTQIKFIADELNRIEKWQKRASSLQPSNDSPRADVRRL